MADLTTDFLGVKSPNPFWLASGPPANTADQVKRAFDAGWGGAVWKTLGDPVRNVNSRYAALKQNTKGIVGINNIELITDRGMSVNLKDISEVKKAWPNNAVVASIMTGSQEEWRTLVRRCQDAGADALELNFGCPHGMCERGMGSAIGQEPQVAEMLTRWVMEVATVPVLVKFTPNVADITEQGHAAMRAGAPAAALINGLKSIVGVDLDEFIPFPKGRSASTNGGYCGTAIKPVALHMVASLARHPDINLVMSGIGGISTWRDAAEFLALGCTSVQVCTAVMLRGFGIVDDMITGLSDYLDSKGMASVDELIGRAVPQFKNWGELDMNYRVRPSIDADKCIKCHQCYTSCYDGAYQAIAIPDGPDGEAKPVPVILEDRCVGCNLCAMVCPVSCIDMKDTSATTEEESWEQVLARGGYTVTDGVLPK